MADPIAFALKYHVQNAREPQWCEHCEETWPCVTKMLAERLKRYIIHFEFIEQARDRFSYNMEAYEVYEEDLRQKHSPKRSRKK